MKANEAPEKLYFGEMDKGILDIYSTKESDNEVEYTRTDAFIEKACDWIEDNASNYIIKHPFSSDVDFEEDKMIKDFKNYMKGEE